MDTPTSLSTFSQAGVVRGVGVGVRGGWVGVSVAVGLVGVVWRLLGGSRESHAALGQ